MITLNAPDDQAKIAVLFMTLACMAWLVVPTPFAPIGLPVLLLGLIVAIQRPLFVCLMFVLLSCFRLHEAFPFLIKFKLPLFFGALTIASSFWHLFLARTIRVFWPVEAKILLFFFALVTAGMVFAKTRGLALDAWSGSFVKVVSIAFVLMWITRTPKEFEMVSRGIVVAGILLAAVAVSNKFRGIGFVEGTRVTVGRDVGSPNGDPNLLSLTLLFPLSFAVSLAMSRTGYGNRLLGMVGAILIVPAIVFTQSRGGLLGVVAVAGVIAIRKVKSKTLVLCVGAFVAVALYAAMGISDRLTGAAGAGSSEAATTRLYSWQAGLNMALTRPLTGVGFNNFESEYIFFTPVWIKQNYTAHSIWFLVLGEIGFPGLFAFVALVAVTLRNGFRTLARFDSNATDERLKAVGIALAAGLAGFSVAGTFLSASYMWPLYILLALSVALAKETGETETARPAHEIFRQHRWAQHNDAINDREKERIA